MSYSSHKNSSQAQQWAEQRQQQIEKAKKIREQRKLQQEVQEQQQQQQPQFNNKPGSTNFYDRPPSRDELQQAQQSLQLLKSKISKRQTITSSFNVEPYESAGPASSINYNSHQSTEDQYSNYNHQYEQDNYDDDDYDNYESNYQQQTKSKNLQKLPYQSSLQSQKNAIDNNQNYRKVFNVNQSDDKGLDEQIKNINFDLGMINQKVSNVEKKVGKNRYTSYVDKYFDDDENQNVYNQINQQKNDQKTNNSRKSLDKPPIQSIPTTMSKPIKSNKLPPSTKQSYNFQRKASQDNHFDYDASEQQYKNSKNLQNNNKYNKKNISYNQDVSDEYDDLDNKYYMQQQQQQKKPLSSKKPINQKSSAQNSFNTSSSQIKKYQQYQNDDYNNNSSENDQSYTKVYNKQQKNPVQKPNKSTSKMNSSQQNYQKSNSNSYDERIAQAKNSYEDIDEQEQQHIQLFKCPKGCGRKFAKEALDKHTKVCQKVFQQKRKVFNTQEKRIVDAEIQSGGGGINYKSKNTMKKNQVASSSSSTMKKNKNSQSLSKPDKWKNQSEAFRAMLQQARGQTISSKQQSQITSAYEEQNQLIQCQYCMRKFNEKAAEKHIPFCKTKQQKDNIKKGGKGGKVGGRKY